MSSPPPSPSKQQPSSILKTIFNPIVPNANHQDLFPSKITARTIFTGVKPVNTDRQGWREAVKRPETQLSPTRPSKENRKDEVRPRRGYGEEEGDVFLGPPSQPLPVNRPPGVGAGKVRDLARHYHDLSVRGGHGNGGGGGLGGGVNVNVSAANTESSRLANHGHSTAPSLAHGDSTLFTKSENVLPSIPSPSALSSTGSGFTSEPPSSSSSLSGSESEGDRVVYETRHPSNSANQSSSFQSTAPTTPASPRWSKEIRPTSVPISGGGNTTPKQDRVIPRKAPPSPIPTNGPNANRRNTKGSKDSDESILSAIGSTHASASASIEVAKFVSVPYSSVKAAEVPTSSLLPPSAPSTPAKTRTSPVSRSPNARQGVLDTPNAVPDYYREAVSNTGRSPLAGNTPAHNITANPTGVHRRTVEVGTPTKTGTVPASAFVHQPSPAHRRSISAAASSMTTSNNNTTERPERPRTPVPPVELAFGLQGQGPGSTPPFPHSSPVKKQLRSASQSPSSSPRGKGTGPGGIGLGRPRGPPSPVRYQQPLGQGRAEGGKDGEGRPMPMPRRSDTGESVGGGGVQLKRGGMTGQTKGHRHSRSEVVVSSVQNSPNVPSDHFRSGSDVAVPPTNANANAGAKGKAQSPPALADPQTGGGGHQRHRSAFELSDGISVANAAGATRDDEARPPALPDRPKNNRNQSAFKEVLDLSPGGGAGVGGIGVKDGKVKPTSKPWEGKMLPPIRNQGQGQDGREGWVVVDGGKGSGGQQNVAGAPVAGMETEGERLNREFEVLLDEMQVSQPIRTKMLNLAPGIKSEMLRSSSNSLALPFQTSCANVGVPYKRPAMPSFGNDKGNGNGKERIRKTRSSNGLRLRSNTTSGLPPSSSDDSVPNSNADASANANTAHKHTLSRSIGASSSFLGLVKTCGGGEEGGNGGSGGTADKDKDPAHWAVLIKSKGYRSLDPGPRGEVRKLRVLLRNEPPAWIGEFITYGGYTGMLERLKELLEVEWREEQHDDQVLYELLRCFKALLMTEVGRHALASKYPTPFQPLVELLYSEKKPGDLAPRQIILELLLGLFEIFPEGRKTVDAQPPPSHGTHSLNISNTATTSANELATSLITCSSQNTALPQFLTPVHLPRIYKKLMTELGGVVSDYFWVFCHSGNMFWDLDGEKKDRIEELERPKVPGGMTGGVEMEAMEYCTSHLRLINKIASTIDRPADGGKRLREFHEGLWESGFERIIMTLRKASQSYYVPLHLELARYVGPAFKCGFKGACGYNIVRYMESMQGVVGGPLTLGEGIGAANGKGKEKKKD